MLYVYTCTVGTYDVQTYIKLTPVGYVIQNFNVRTYSVVHTGVYYETGMT